MSQNKPQNIIFISFAIAAMIAGAWLGSVKEQEKIQEIIEIQGAILPIAKTIIPFQLTDHNEQAFTLDNFKGHWSLVFVGYTQCPDVCPASLSVLKQVHQFMSEQNITVPEVIFISVDPERDTYPLLNKYVTYFNSDFLGVSGDLNQLKIITQQLSVTFAKAPGSNGKIEEDDYLMDHSSSFMLINPDGKLQAFLTAPHTPMKIIDSIIRSQEHYRKNN